MSQTNPVIQIEVGRFVTWPGKRIWSAKQAIARWSAVLRKQRS